MSLTYPQAIALFDTASANGTVKNRKTGKLERLKPSRRGPILSNVRKALIRALASVGGNDGHTDARMNGTDIEPYLLTLPLHGRLAEREDSPDDEKAAGKVESNVRLFVSTITGRDVARDSTPVSPARVPESFRPLYAAVDEWAAKDLKKRRSIRRGFVRFTELATLCAVGHPADVPDDYATIMKWGVRAGWSKKDTQYALNGWRRAVELADAPYAMAWDWVCHNGIGIKSLQDFGERVRARGFSGDLAGATAPDLSAILAPKLATALERIVATGLKDGLSASWAGDMRDMCSWLVAALIRLGEDPASMSWFDLWIDRRPVAATSDGEQDEQLACYGIERTSGIELHSLMRRAVDTTTKRSYQLSRLWLLKDEHEADVIPVYTDSMLRNFEMAFTVTQRFFGERMHQQKPELWAQASTEYKSCGRYFAGYNKGRVLMGRKAKSSLPISWPQMVCMGLPWLASECYRLRREVYDREARIGHLESRESQQLLSEYCDALFEYAVASLITDDSLRIKNYSGAHAQEHIIVTPIRDGSRWVGVANIRTAFTALDQDGVSLKSKKVSGGEHNSRDRRVTPGIVDHVLWFDFWMIARPRRLVTAGLLATVDAFNPDDDHAAVFPTPRPSSHQRDQYLSAMAEHATRVAAGEEATMPHWRGGISEDMLSATYGRALHRICRDVLHRDLPDWDAPELTELYFGIFGAHIARLMTASYFGGVLERWMEAMYRTNDEEITLRRYYVRLSAWAKEREHLDTPEGLRWFNAVLDRVLKLKSVDDGRWPQFWATFDPTRPHLAIEWLDRAAEETATRHGRRRGPVTGLAAA